MRGKEKALMNVSATRRATWFAVCLLSFGCQRQAVENEAPPFRIVATDAALKFLTGLPQGCVISLSRIAHLRSTRVCLLSSQGERARTTTWQPSTRDRCSRKAPWI